MSFETSNPDVQMSNIIPPEPPISLLENHKSGNFDYLEQRVF